MKFMRGFFVIWSLLILTLTYVGFTDNEGNSTPSAHEESLGSKASQGEQARLKAEKESAFIEEMLSYETEGVIYEGGIAGSHAKFTLKDVSMKEMYVFGEQLPVGNKATMSMAGRGSSGVGRAGDTLPKWSKAGTWGTRHYEGRDIISIKLGDYVQFSNLSSVKVTIWF